MIDLLGYDKVPAVLPGEFAKLPAGGYICRVIHAEETKSKAGNKMLVLYIDIAEGEYSGHFRDAFDRVKNSRPDIKWDNSGIYRQLIYDKTGKVSRFFKGLMTCFEMSNATFSVHSRTLDEKNLRGLLIGFVFAEEEYLKKTGEIGIRAFAKFPKPIDDIRAGNFTVPEPKKFEQAKSSTQADLYSTQALPSPNSTDDLGGTQIDIEDPPF